MSELYISEPGEWKMFHIPFTPYFLAKDPETRLWNLVEKELSHSDIFDYHYRYL